MKERWKEKRGKEEEKRKKEKEGWKEAPPEVHVLIVILIYKTSFILDLYCKFATLFIAYDCCPNNWICSMLQNWMLPPISTLV